MIKEISEKQKVGLPVEPNTENNDQTQRGHYRQYEESQTLIDKIRAYRRQRYPDSEIMKLLDDMPRRTYYNYVKKMQEQDRELIEEWMEDHIDQVSEEFFVFKENASQILRQLQGIIDDTKVPTKERMKAIQQYYDISESSVNLSAQRSYTVVSVLKSKKWAIKEEEERQLWMKPREGAARKEAEQA